MNKLFFRIYSKLDEFGCKYMFAETNELYTKQIDKDDVYSDCWITYKCKCGTECVDFAFSIDRYTTPLCSTCETLEVNKVLHEDRRVYLYGLTFNKCKIICDICKCMFDTGKLKAYKKIIMNKVVCVQCNKQRKE